MLWFGSRDYDNEEIDGNVNVAMRPRQPGSSFKPLVYAQGLREGYTIDTTIYDLPTEFNPTCTWDTSEKQNRGSNGQRCYRPENYDFEYMGAQPIKEALAQSRNITAVKMIYLVGVEDTVDLARNMGVTTLEEVENDQWSLGLGSGEVTLLEETAAYGVFAAQGDYTQPLFILEVKDKDGDIHDSFISETKEVLDENVANQITHALSVNAYRAPVFGPSNNLNVPGITVAAKTGTTQKLQRCLDRWIYAKHKRWCVGWKQQRR